MNITSSDAINTGADLANARLKSEAESMDRLCAEAIERFAQKKVEGQIRATWNCSVAKKLVAENSEFLSAQTVGSRRADFLVHVARRKGSASTNLDNIDAMATCIDNAVDLASCAPEDPYLVMPSNSDAPPAKELDFLYSPSVASLELEELAESVQILNQDFAREKKFHMERAEISLEVAYSGIKTSSGITQNSRRAQVSWVIGGLGVDGSHVSGIDFEVGGSFSGDFDREITLGFARLREKVLGSIRPVACPSYKGLVILSPRAVYDIFGAMIGYHLGGKQIIDGKSVWSKSLGNEVASPLLTLVDDPGCPEFLSASAFDREGLPTQLLPLITQGRLVNFTHDFYSARRLGVPPNASAGGPFGLSFGAGNTDLRDMLHARREILLVDRFSGYVNPSRGTQVSGVAKGSALYVNGQRKGTVIETMISGDFAAWIKQIAAISKEVECPTSRYKSPYILVDAVSVAGH